MNLYINDVLTPVKIIKASTFLTRLKGWIGRKNIDSDEGLWIFPCKQIHTFGLRCRIDVLFLDRQGYVVGIAEQIAPWRVSSLYSDASSVLELKSGRASEYSLKIGDCIQFKDPSNRHIAPLYNADSIRGIQKK